jgi:PAS domain S-box-containing protein/diguanylate cyclase (GGDEF)-like protein
MPASTREWLKRIHSEDRELFRTTSIEAGRRGTRMSVEYRIRHEDGAWIHVSQVMEAIDAPAAAAGRKRWFNTLQDTSREKQAAEALRASEERHRAMFEQAAVGIVHTTLDGNVRTVNAKFCEMSGYTRAEAVQLSIRDLIGPEDVQKSLSARSQVLSGTGAPYELEPRLLRKDRSETWVHVTTSLIRAADGQPSYFISVFDDISERKRAQEAVQQERNFTHAALDSLPGLFYLIDDQGRFLRWNKNFETVSGYASEEISRLAPTELFAGPEKAVVAAKISEVFTTGDATVEAELVAKNGTRTPYFFTGTLVQLDQKACLSGMGIDITARKQAEHELQRFRMAMDVSPDSIYLTDLATMRFVYLNNTACQRLGYSREQMLQMGPQDVLATGSEQISSEYDDVIAAGDLGLTHERKFVRSDGSEGWTELHRRALRTEGGRLIVTIGRDITERKQAEKALLDSQKRFRQTFELAASGMAHIALDGRFLRVNRKLCEMLGYREEELIRYAVKDVSHPDDRNVTDVQRARLRSREINSASFEKRYLCKDGSVIWISLTVALARNAAGEPDYEIAVFEDITARKAQLEKIERLSRVYAVLSGINSAIVRIGDRDELFRETCRIAVEQGGFGIAQMLLVDEDAYEVWPGPHAGMDALPVVRASFRPGAETISTRGTTIRAIRERKPVFTNDITLEPPVGALRAEALRRGYGSVISLPLTLRERIVAVLLLNAKEKNFFDEQELRLMRELANDVSFALESLEKASRLDYLAYYDPLTGLANRSLLHERLSQYLRTPNQGDTKLALALMNVERFKTINDSLGRQAGDELLKQLAVRLALAAAPANIARIGGDQFAIILPEVKGRSEVARRIERIWRDCFVQPYRISGSDLRISAKTGMALHPTDGADAEALFANAEAALQKAQETGERHQFHTRDLTEGVAAELALENQLRQALEKEEFVLHYQPKVDLETRAIVGVEALIRWQSPELGLVPPMKFIPLMEETGLILEAGTWALKQAAQDHRKWFDLGLKAPRVAVNVSPIQLRQRDFVASVERAIIEGIAPTGIDLEITESLIMEDVQGSIAKLKAARDLGVHIAVDDFGTGYSSLGYLAKLPVQTLKIDRSFIITMLGDPDTMTLVQTIISLAHSLRLKVVAEGVDKEEQAKMLRLLRCDEMQGYLYSKPVPFEAMTALLRQEKKT